MTLSHHQILARKGEDAAEEYLRKKKYQILLRNYRCPLGEMDLVAQKGKTLVFVEVKTRSSPNFGDPGEAVNSRKKKKLYQLAEFYLKEKGLSDIDVQFDVLSILLSPDGSSFEISHFDRAIEF